VFYHKKKRRKNCQFERIVSAAMLKHHHTLNLIVAYVATTILSLTFGFNSQLYYYAYRELSYYRSVKINGPINLATRYFALSSATPFLPTA
ncbi:MAG: hypothetical protein ACI93R_002323, partial [Flavobacteriales bacterium]